MGPFRGGNRLYPLWCGARSDFHALKLASDRSGPPGSLAAMKLPSWPKRDDPATVNEAVRRSRVADFIVDYRTLCEDVGPWQYAADLHAPQDVTLRHLAYLAVWRDGPTLRIWEDVLAVDAADLVIDAAIEGFQAFLAAHPAEAS